MELISIKKRSDFVNIKKNGEKSYAKGLILETKENKNPTGNIRVGYTATKRLGNAVTRNRIKRRFRALSSQILPLLARPDYDYVIIGRKGTLERSLEDLKKDLKYSLHKTNTHIKYFTGAQDD
jgi:ribonuclease P protein component